jgi:diadenosine tetraphosphate (Ap4A) HIT family hydrolase
MDLEILQTPHWIIRHCSDAAIPGYVVIASSNPCVGLGNLPQPAIEELGGLLSRTAKAVELAVCPERVYICMFGESTSGLHFHIFPRMGWMKDWSRHIADDSSQPIDGAFVSSTARRLLSGSADLQKEESRMIRATSAIRKFVADDAPLPKPHNGLRG